MEQTRFSPREYRPNRIEDEKFELEKKANALEEERSPLIDRKREIELTLTHYLTIIRSGKLSTSEYLDLCEKQNELKREKFDVENKILQLKRDIRKLSEEKEALTLKIKRQPKENAVKVLTEMRDKYIQFSSDTSRVSSMRAMASKFVEELQDLIKQF